MKKPVLFIICLSLFLTACGNEKKEAEETDIIETNAVSETAETVHVTEIVTEKTAVLVTEEELPADTGEASSSVVIADESVKKEFAFNAQVDLNDFADEGFYPCDISAAGGNILLVEYGYNPNLEAGEEKPPYLCGIDLENSTQLFRIDSPEIESSFDLYRNLTDGKATGCAALGRYYGEGNISLTEVDEKGNYTVTDSAGEEDIVYSWADKAVKCVNGSIVNAADGSVLCARTDEENDPNFVKSKSYYFDMPLDEDRFIVQRLGYEWSEGVGVYSFETNETVMLPDSFETGPLGVHNGMIYTIDAFDGVGVNIYVYDSEDSERRLLCGSPFELGMNDMLYYSMPENGEYITAVFIPGYDSDSSFRFAVLSPETGEIMTEYSLPEETKNIYPAFFTKDNICLWDNDRDMIYTAPIPSGSFSLEDKGDVTELSYTYFGNTETVKSYDNSKSTNPELLTLRNFENVMGLDGIYLTEKSDQYWYRTYYYADMGGKYLKIAESFGRNGWENDTVTDIDGDGINELICNCGYSADDGQECYIYKMTDEGVMRASGHDFIDSEKIMEQTTASNVSSKYLPEKNKMLCEYPNVNGEYVKEEVDIDIDKLNFKNYHTDDTPPADE